MNYFAELRYLEKHAKKKTIRHDDLFARQLDSRLTNGLGHHVKKPRFPLHDVSQLNELSVSS